MPDSDYIKGLQAASRIALKMADDQRERPNASMVLGWLHVEICGLIEAARKEVAELAK
jgi:hypothetical protein